MQYVSPQEISAFLLITRKRHTLAGFDPRKRLWAIPGGGVRAGENLYEAAIREFQEECGTKIRLQLVESTPELYYIRVDTHEYIEDIQALSAGPIKLHAVFRMVAVSADHPQEREREKFQSPAFHGELFFEDKRKLRPSVAHTLEAYKTRRTWPFASLSNVLKQPDMDTIRFRLMQMRLQPKLVNELTACAVAA